MDNKDSKPVKEEANMDSKDWRAYLKPEDREEVFNMITNDMKSCYPSFPVVVLKQMAVICEKKTFSAAMSLEDYILKISTRMVNMENRTQTFGKTNSSSSNSSWVKINPPNPASINSILRTPTRHLSIVDEQEEIYKKFKSMKEMYLPTMIQTRKRMAKIVMPERFVHFESYRNFLKHLISILVISEIEIPLDLENLDIFEMVIKVFLNVCPLSSFIPSQQQGQQKLHPQTQMQPTSVSSLQHGSMPSLSTYLGTPAVQPNIINEMQSDSALETVQGNALGSLEQSQNSTSNPISPSTPLAPSPIPGNPEQHISRVSKHSSAGNIGQTEGAIPLSTIISAKPSETEQAEQPIVVKSVSAKSLAITAVDRLEGSTPDNGSRAAVDGDLEDTEKCHFKLNEIPVDAVSSDDSMNNRFKRSAGPEITELESSTESLSRIKKPRV